VFFTSTGLCARLKLAQARRSKPVFI